MFRFAILRLVSRCRRLLASSLILLVLSAAPALAQPIFTKAFAPDTIAPGGTTTLTFTINNLANVLAADFLDFTDVLPAGVRIAAVPNAVNGCNGGALTANAGTTVISYTNGSVAASDSCTITVDVTSSTPGSHVNTTDDLTSNRGNSGQATATLIVTGGLETAKIRKETLAAIESFLFRRNDRLLTGGPDQTRWINRLTGRSGGVGAPAFGFAAHGEGAARHYAFAASLQQFGLAMAQTDQRAGLADPAALKVKPVRDDPAAIDIWIEGQVSHFDDDTGNGATNGTFGLARIGADTILRPWLLVGLLLEADWTDENSTILGSAVDGTGWMVGPYMLARLGRSVFLDARFAVGRSHNEVAPFNGAPVAAVADIQDDFETDRFLLQGRLSGDFRHGNLRIVPAAEVAYIEEHQRSFTNSVGVFIPDQSVALGQLKFGPTVSYLYARPDGTLIEPLVSIEGVWNFDQAESLTVNGFAAATEDWRTRLEAGLSVTRLSGANLRATANLDGIGSDNFMAYGGEIKLSIPLN